MTYMVAGLNQLYDVKEDLETLKQNYPELSEQLVHVVSLTRQLQLKYGYMGSLLMDDDLPAYEPKFLRGSVLHLYQQEVQKLKDHPDIDQLTQVMQKHKDINDSKIFLLTLGAKPELLQGSQIMS
ncbi:hypothetical protein [Salimicrobium halophilum]|uniref:Uncharacterized protein n=1 Tax=Salimicrobium halophilum TaxID=86666 RepID=A0A1G8RFW4_9BACI|nr:hypothetical protein [Salimicrobium halophilum]SDJ15270.1 hypothetical protein SAMN04490247_0979 [Salimicrobium halophilum]